jgi:hypothetical protein
MQTANERLIRQAELHHADYAYNRRGPIKTACEWINFVYTPDEEKTLKELCLEGKSIFEMSDILARPTDDVFVILWDLSQKGKIRPGNWR